MAYFVKMDDSFMSGWGDAAGKTNVFVVECDTLDQADQIEAAANRREEMKCIEIYTEHPPSQPNAVYSNRHYNDLSGPWKA